MLKKIERDVERQIKTESGAVAYSIRIFPAKPDFGLASGMNVLRMNEIKILIAPELLKQLDAKNIYRIVLDIARHEIGHWEYPHGSGCGCPFDIHHAYTIYTAIERTLKQVNKSSYADYVANMFMDIIDNFNIAYHLKNLHNDYPVGLVWFYLDQGKHAKVFSPAYSFMMKIQERLWITHNDTLKLKKYHPENSDIDFAVDSFFAEIGLTSTSSDYERWDILVRRKSFWRRYASHYASLVEKFLPKELELIVEILVGGENKNTKSKIIKYIFTPGVKAKIIVKWVYENNPELENEDPYKVLDIFYRELARTIPIKIESPQEGMKFPIFGYYWDDAQYPTKKIGINKYGDVSFKKPKYYWMEPINVKKDVGGVPNIFFLLDTSSSMLDTTISNVSLRKDLPNSVLSKWSIYSKYHYALLSFYGVIGYLQRNELIPQKIALLTFSSSTNTKIVSFENLNELWPLLFNPEFNGTYLDFNMVNYTVRKLGKCIMIMLSDGEIENWNEISPYMKRIMRNNFSCFISLLSKSLAYYELSDVSKVFYVENAKDLSRVMIEFTRETILEV